MSTSQDHSGRGGIRVLVNLTWLTPGVVGGSEESTTDALRALLEHHREVELTLAVQRGFADAHRDLADACRCEFTGPTAASRVTRVIGDQTWLPALTRRLRPDVTHHAGGVLPLAHPGPTVLTIHDLQPLDMPQNFGRAKRWYIRSMVGRSARAADTVCVPSDFTAARLVERLGVPRGRIEVVPWSVVRLEQFATESRRGGSVGPPSGDGGPPLFVYPAITYPHKNHLVLLEAFSRVLAQMPGAELVLPGGDGPEESVVRQRLQRGDLRHRVRRPGRLSTSEMDQLYRRATAVVVPSTYEGFGLPALEAMVRGVPLLVADAGSLPEVVSIRDVPATPVAPIDPADPAAWADAMLEVARLSDEQRRAVVAHQREAAGRFTPKATADALSHAYHRAAGRAVSSHR